MTGDHDRQPTAPSTDPVSHTPGPWWVERRVGDALQVNARHRGEGSSYCVASVNHWEGDADRANARLIAAAPDLLAAINAMLNHYRTEGCPDPKCRLCERSKTAEAAANAAVAKAEGRS